MKSYFKEIIQIIKIHETKTFFTDNFFYNFTNSM